MSKPFEEIVKELKSKFGVAVDPVVVTTIVKVVERELKDLIRKKALSVEGVRTYFKEISGKIWCLRRPLGSVDELIERISKKCDVRIPATVKDEINVVYTSLTSETLFAAAAFVKMKRPIKPVISVDDVEVICVEFLLMPKPHWLC